MKGGSLVSGEEEIIRDIHRSQGNHHLEFVADRSEGHLSSAPLCMGNGEKAALCPDTHGMFFRLCRFNPDISGRVSRLESRIDIDADIFYGSGARHRFSPEEKDEKKAEEKYRLPF